jgi:transposase
VFPGNTSDAVSFKTAITRVRDDFGIANLILVGDRGMITKTRIAELRQLPGMDWITALRAPAITALTRDDGPLQMSLFDEHNLTEISHPGYPGERLICCRNPVLATERARKRQELLAATAQDLAKITQAVDTGKLTGADKIGERVGKVIDKHKVGKHFIREITDTSFVFHRDEEKIAAEAAFDGIYVIRTSVPTSTLDPAGTVTAYKNLNYVERDFRITKTDDLDLRPIYHYLENRVRAHVLICMLAAYLTWHLREAFAELTYTDQNIPPAHDPIAPAQRSAQAKTNEGAQAGVWNRPTAGSSASGAAGN